MPSDSDSSTRSPSSQPGGSPTPPSNLRFQPGGSPALLIPIMVQKLTNPYQSTIDVTKANGLKLFQNAMQGLSDDQKFNLSVNTVRKFRKQPESAAINFNWGVQVFKVPSGVNHINLITYHNQFLEADVTVHTKTIWDLDSNNKISDQIDAATLEISDKRV